MKERMDPSILWYSVEPGVLWINVSVFLMPLQRPAVFIEE